MLLLSLMSFGCLKLNLFWILLMIFLMMFLSVMMLEMLLYLLSIVVMWMCECFICCSSCLSDCVLGMKSVLWCILLSDLGILLVWKRFLMCMRFRIELSLCL